MEHCTIFEKRKKMEVDRRVVDGLAQLSIIGPREHPPLVETFDLRGWPGLPLKLAVDDLSCLR